MMPGQSIKPDLRPLTIAKAANITLLHGEEDNVIFKNACMAFETGTMYALTGDSGSGKTTLLYCLDVLEDSYQGEILVDGQNIRDIGLDAHRRKNISLIFQDYGLIEYLNPLENLLVSMDIAQDVACDKKKAMDLLALVGLQDKAKRRSSLLSEGEKQRVAIARSLACGTDFILADEPTGNLDASTASDIIKILQDLAHMQGKCVIVATHSIAISSAADVVLTINRASHSLERTS